MNKPVLPVSAEWIRPITPIERFIAYTPLSEVLDSKLIQFDRRITITGAFGRFLTIEFEMRLYVIPAPMVQGLLWSIDEGIGHQFSDEEQRLLAGTCGEVAVASNLEREMTRLCDWLQKPRIQGDVAGIPATQARQPKLSVSDSRPSSIESEDGCPEPQFFDEVQS